MAKTQSAIPAIPTSVPFPQLVITVPNTQATPPARQGCARYVRWQLLLTLGGKTVGDYYAAWRKIGSPCTRNTPTLAHNKGLVVLTAPKS